MTRAAVPSVVEIHDPAELAELCGGDALCLWAAQGLRGGSRAFADAAGGAVAVAGPGVSARDRLALWEREPGAGTELAAAALAVVGRTFRPLGAPDAVRRLVAAVPGLAPTRAFDWMDTGGPLPASGRAVGRAEWLPPGAAGEVDALLDLALPSSDARPGRPAGGRWAGVRAAGAGAGRLVAVAALAWCAPEVALVCGVAVHPEARGGGLGEEVCRFVTEQALHAHPRVALMVDEDNGSARRLYARLGYRPRPLLAAAFPG